MRDSTANIATLLQQHLAHPERIIYRQFVDGGWRDYAAADVATLAARWQQGFRESGLKAGDAVALCVRNGVDWVAVDLAALGMGLVAVPLYVDDNAENVAWCLEHSGAKLLVLGNSRLLSALKSGARLPPTVCLKDGGGAVTADAWLPAAAPAFEVRELPPETLATIVYTSGTTGRPKGAMLSHGNILSNVSAAIATGMGRADDVFLSLLPLSHMLERTAGYYLPLALGAQVVYARGMHLLAEDFSSQRPTIVIAVPRLFERLLGRVRHALAKSPLKRALFHIAVAAGWREFQKRAGLHDRIFGLRIRAAVAKPILGGLGGRLRLAVVGGAALQLPVARTFFGLGLTLLHGYGLTETSPVVSVNLSRDNEPASVGPPLQGVEVRLGEGDELLVRGPNVMLGYWRYPEGASQPIDREGWLHTGDLAAISAGKIYIRGRAKDILVLSNGEKLPPDEVEAAILQDPVFEQVMVAGEGRAYPVLVAVTKEGDRRTLVKRANARLTAFPRYMRVRQVIVSTEPWTTDNGLLTPTMKVKRGPVLKRFASEIDDAYRALLD